MCYVCDNCNKQVADKNCSLCEACLDYHAQQQEAALEYLAELAVYRANCSDEEWEAMSSLDIDDSIPF